MLLWSLDLMSLSTSARISHMDLLHAVPGMTDSEHDGESIVTVAINSVGENPHRVFGDVSILHVCPQEIACIGCSM